MPVRAGGRQTGLDRIVSDEVSIVGILALAEMGCCVADVCLAALVELSADGLAGFLVDNVDSTLEGGVYGTVIREAKGCGVIG